MSRRLKGGGLLIAYAARDVFYLIQLAAELRDELKIKGRLSWVTEECEELSKVRAMPPDNALLFLKIRGAGKSQGEHSEGEGEQEDVNSAVSYLRSLGITRISLAGYFFGAWVNGMAAGKCGEIEQMVMVSPPVGFMDFDPIQPIGNLELIISGSRDDIAPTEGIKQWLSGWAKTPQVEIINGADHFFSGYSTELESVLYSNI